MRFKKGTFVEVMSKNEVPSGSWHCAKVICGNGHNYTVEYKMEPCAYDEAPVERVSRKSIRPSPPLVELSENWAPGDVLEVFQNVSWKMATVCKVLGRNDFLVRLVGFSHEFKVGKCDLRVRQSWQDGKWFVIGKNIGNSEEGKCNILLPRNHNQQLSSQVKRGDIEMNSYATDVIFAEKKSIRSPIICSRTLKRGFPNCHSQVEALPAKTAQKFRLIEKKGRHHRLPAENPSPLPEKVVTVASYREMLDEKHICTTLNNRTTCFTNVDLEGENLSGAVGRSYEIDFEPNDADDIACSVASCSITSNDSFKLNSNFSGGHTNVEYNLSDAESVCHGDSYERNCFFTQKEWSGEIRRLELHAYRCTMEALHASGPLSWEQETLVTNLRLTLNISNDEHLMELRHLASTATSIPFR